MPTDLIVSSSECSVCLNGLLAFMTMEETNEVFLECQECMTGYRDIENPKVGFRCEDLTTDYRPATQTEVDRIALA